MRRCDRRTQPQHRRAAARCLVINRDDSTFHECGTNRRLPFGDDSGLGHHRIVRYRRSINIHGIIGFNFDTINHLGTDRKQPRPGINQRRQFEHPNDKCRLVVDFIERLIRSGFDARHRRDSVGQRSDA